MRRSGRSMNREDRDRGVEMRLTERTGKLIPETRRGVPKGAIGLVMRKEDDVGGRARVTRRVEAVHTVSPFVRHASCRSSELRVQAGVPQ